jgi:hypothetical protein
VRVGVNEVILAAVASSAMTSHFFAELGLIDLVHVSESLGKDTSATRFLEAPAGEGDEQSSLFGLSGLLGSSGGASDPANQTNEIDKIDQTDHPRAARKDSETFFLF